jgi:hypothetical protein
MRRTRFIMKKAEMPQAIESCCYCPDCGEVLAEISCEDPLTLCLSCKSDHRFFIIPKTIPFTLDQTKSYGKKLSAIKIPASSNNAIESVAAFWLSQTEYRDYLNIQLAEMLRAILDRIRHKRRIQEPLLFRWCPVCKSGLSEFKQMDAWMQGLKCSHEHTFYLRGGWLRGSISGVELVLTAEVTDSILNNFIKGWLKPNQYLDPLLPSSIREVFEKFSKTFK